MSSFGSACAFVATTLVLACGGATETPSPAFERAFVAVGQDGAAVRSADGVRWTVAASGTTRKLFSVAAGRALYVAVGEAGTIVTSPDAKTWTTRTSGTTSDLSHVSYADGAGFVAVGGSWTAAATALTSADGIVWTNVPGPERQMFRSAVRVADGTLFVSSIVNSDLRTQSLFRLDGTVWTKLEGPAFSDSLAMPGGAAAIDEFSLVRTADGTSWAETVVTDRELLTGVAYGAGRFVIVGEKGSSFSSGSGQDWTATEASPGTFLSGVAHGGGVFATVGWKGAIFTSPDGAAWARVEPPTDKNLIAVAYPTY